MKTDLKKWLPVMIMAVAVAGAFTTHAMSLKEAKATIVDGYIQPNNPAEECEKDNQCSTVESTELCTVGYISGGTPLFQLEGNQCIKQLYRPEQ